MAFGVDEQLSETLEGNGDVLASSLINFAPVPLAISRERDGLILQVNPRLVELTRTPAKDILGRSAFIFYSRLSDRDAVLREMREKGRVRDFEVEFRRDDGTCFQAALSVEPFVIGQERCLFVTFDDITERKRAERILKESEARLKEAQQIARLGSWVWDLKSGKFDWSEEMYRIHAVTPEERGEDVWELIRTRVHPDDVDHSILVLQLAIESKDGFEFDGRILWPNGEVRSVRVKGEVHRDADGTPATMIGTTQDVTDQKRSEQALAESEAMFRALADTNPVMVAIYQDDKHVYVNQAAELLTGYTHEELLAMPVAELVHPDLREMVRKRGIERQRGEDVPSRYEMQILRKDGTTRWLDFSAARISYQGKPARIGMAVDITERKAAEEALRESEERLELALWGTDLALWDWNLASEEVFVNEQWATILGCEFDQIRPRFADWKSGIHPQDADRVLGLFRDYVTGKLPTCEAEYLFRGKNGRWKWIHTRGKIVERDVAGNPTRITGTHRDITDRKLAEIERAKLETEVQSDEKLKSLGLLAGGIAHDFNNLLMGVLGHAELARNEVLESSPAREHLATIETAAERAAELCHQLLAYSGRGRFLVEQLDLNRAVLETAALLETTIPKKIVMQFELSESGPAIDADSPQIRRVIMNLLTNAADAIGIAPGTVTIRTGLATDVNDGAGTLFCDDSMAAGPFAFVDVADTGVGMNPETIAKMFDPFFTSKFTGRGLGLAAVLGIVRGHKGAIRVNSQPGHGTIIRILFPASKRPKASPSPVNRSTLVSRTGGTILVVDDTEIVRTVARRTLEQAGYHVITADDGNEAIQAFALHRSEIIAVLLDVTMPNLDGDQTFRELKNLGIDVPVLLTSGSDEQETANLFGIDGPAGFLQKPFRPHVLVQKLQEVLRVS